jgi:hypothetical protein
MFTYERQRPRPGIRQRVLSQAVAETADEPSARFPLLSDRNVPVSRSELGSLAAAACSSGRSVLTPGWQKVLNTRCRWCRVRGIQRFPATCHNILSSTRIRLMGHAMQLPAIQAYRNEASIPSSDCHSSSQPRPPNTSLAGQARSGSDPGRFHFQKNRRPEPPPTKDLPSPSSCRSRLRPATEGRRGEDETALGSDRFDRFAAQR